MIKTKLSDYETETVEIEVDGEAFSLEIRSMASREFQNARAEYQAIMLHAERNKTPLVEEFDHGLGVKSEQPTEYAKKALAILLAPLVVEWPFGDIKEALVESEDLSNLVDSVAARLMREFAAKKKT